MWRVDWHPWRYLRLNSTSSSLFTYSLCDGWSDRIGIGTLLSELVTSQPHTLHITVCQPTSFATNFGKADYNPLLMLQLWELTGMSLECGKFSQSKLVSRHPLPDQAISVHLLLPCWLMLHICVQGQAQWYLKQRQNKLVLWPCSRTTQVSWHQNSNPFLTFMFLEVLFTLSPHANLVLMATGCYASRPDSITGMAHWRWSDKHWPFPLEILCWMPFLWQDRIGTVSKVA